LDPFAWPLAIVVIAIVFMVLFRGSIEALLHRTKKLGTSGLETHDQLPAAKDDVSPLDEFMGSFDNPLLKEQEAVILKELADRRLTDPEAIQRVLVRSLAGTQILAVFEKIQATIFASQIDLLTHLNGAHDGIGIEQSRVFFEKAAEAYPLLYQGRSFEEWSTYLSSYGLVNRERDHVVITRIGREYLKWRLDQGRVGPSFG
jgi:hypothetical protein